MRNAPPSKLAPNYENPWLSLLEMVDFHALSLEDIPHELHTNGNDKAQEVV